MFASGLLAEDCPIGFTADIIGDKWAIIILRDIALLSRRTFNQLRVKNVEGISSATLAKRLKRLEDVGLLSIRHDPGHLQKKIYCLTEPAIQFVPIIFALGHWARMHSRATDWLNTPIAPFYQGDDHNMAIFLEGLRQIHLEGTPLNKVHPIFGQLAS